MYIVYTEQNIIFYNLYSITMNIYSILLLRLRLRPAYKSGGSAGFQSRRSTSMSKISTTDVQGLNHNHTRTPHLMPQP